MRAAAPPRPRGAGRAAPEEAKLEGSLVPERCDCPDLPSHKPDCRRLYFELYGETLPEPIERAVRAGQTTINGPKGLGLVWTSTRILPENQLDPDNRAEYAVHDPWGQVHMVVTLSRESLSTNCLAYALRVKREAIAGNEKAAVWFAQRAFRICVDAGLVDVEEPLEEKPAPFKLSEAPWTPKTPAKKHCRN